MDQPEYGTNHSYYLDFIQVHLKTQLINSDEIRHFYLNEGLSATQIAERFGVGKTFVIRRLHLMGIRGAGNERKCQPTNYRHHNPPYGYRVKDGKLVMNNSELRICRLVVKLMSEQKLGPRETANVLIQRQIKNRRGDANWGHSVVASIFKRWRDKV